MKILIEMDEATYGFIQQSWGIEEKRCKAAGGVRTTTPAMAALRAVAAGRVARTEYEIMTEGVNSEN